eukprot:scaffold12916_cov14-Tisochrysis_lutea.AAC.1
MFQKESSLELIKRVKHGVRSIPLIKAIEGQRPETRHRKEGTYINRGGLRPKAFLWPPGASGCEYQSSPPAALFPSSH